MEYEFRVWKDAEKVPKLKPEKADDRITAITNTTASIITGKTKGDPDILIDADGAGENAISSAHLSYYNSKIKENGAEVVKRFIKIKINGNLYLPLDNSLSEAAKSAAGLNTGDENKKRDTVLLSKWAAAMPEDDKTKPEPYYRGVILWIMTKAGDFRIVTANNMYIETYDEDYKEGEFGTFQLVLMQKMDSSSKFEVAGLGYEKVSKLAQMGKAISDAAEKVETAGAVIAATGAVAKVITETVEKFTGETAATKWIKYSADTTSSAGKVVKSGSSVMKDHSLSNITEEIQNTNEEVNDRIQKGKEDDDSVKKLSELEKEYLDAIKDDPDKYEEYKTSEIEDKIKMLEKEKNKKETKEDEKKLKEKYLADIKADSELYAEYLKADHETRIQMLKAAKENAEDKAEEEANKKISGADLNTMLNDAANKKNGNSQ